MNLEHKRRIFFKTYVVDNNKVVWSNEHCSVQEPQASNWKLFRPQVFQLFGDEILGKTESTSFKILLLLVIHLLESFLHCFDLSLASGLMFVFINCSILMPRGKRQRNFFLFLFLATQAYK